MPKFLAALIVLTAGCATTVQDAISGQAEGTSAVYPTTKALAIEAAKEIFTGVGADPVTVEGDRITGASLRILRRLESDLSPISGGTFMVAWVEPWGADAVRVTVVTKRSKFADVMDLSETDFHRRMLTILGR